LRSLTDDVSQASVNFTVLINPIDAGATLLNPTQNNSVTQLPGLYITQAAVGNITLGTNVLPFSIDGRWLHAFNGPGANGLMTTSAGLPVPNTTTGLPALLLWELPVHGPLYRGSLQLARAHRRDGAEPDGVCANSGDSRDGRGLRRCDLENWFMAVQSADGQGDDSLFHRPGIIRYDPNNGTAPTTG